MSLEKIKQVISEKGIEINEIKRCTSDKFDLNIYLQLFSDIANELMPVRDNIKLKFIFDKENTALITELIKYFWGQPSCRLELTKGVVLYGKTGTGKSMIFDVLNILTAMEGAYGIPFKAGNQPCYFNLKKIHAGEMTSEMVNKKFELFNNCLKYRSLFIDEIGKDLMKVNFWGNEICPFETIIETRDLFPNLLFGTTNLSLNELKERYGDRVYSRLNKMVTFIEVTGNDRRN